MVRRDRLLGSFVVILTLFAAVGRAHAQQPGESRWIIDFGLDLALPINGNVNSGAIGVLEDQATAVLPNPYGDVYGTGRHLRFGVGT